MTKKLLALILCAVMMTSVLAACGGSSAPAATQAPAATEAPAPDPTEAPAPEPAEEPAAEAPAAEPAQQRQRSAALTDPLAPLTGPVFVPTVFNDGVYRIVANADQLKGEGRVVYSAGSLDVWAYGAAAAENVELSTAGVDEPLHYILQSIGGNSSFTVVGGEIVALTLRPPTFGTTQRNAKYLDAAFMDGIEITVACNPKQSPDGGAASVTDTSIVLSDTLTNVTFDLGGSTETVDLSKADGAVYEHSDDNGTRSFTVASNGDGTVTVTYTVA